MPKRQRLGWYSFYKNSVNTIRAIIPNPPPIDAKPPVRLPCGALCFEKTQPELSYSAAPIIPSRLGTLKSNEEIAEMRRVYQRGAALTQMARRYAVSPSFIANQIMPKEEKIKMEASVEKRFLNSSICKIRGALVSARIRQIRNDAF